MGQWVALKGETRETVRYMEVNVDNLIAGHLIGKEYKRGEDFPVSLEGEFITERTPEDRKEAAKAAGLNYLKFLIDSGENKALA